MAIVLQLSALLLQRRAEVAGMRRSELNAQDKTWLIPAERSKSGRAHLVPVPPKAWGLIEEALRLADFGRDKPSPMVFPGRRSAAKSLSPDAVSHALADVALAAGVEGVTVHDFRRTGASVLVSERLGFPAFLVSRLLGHTSDTGGAAVVTLQHYAVYDYAPENWRALAAWEDELLAIVGERPRAPKFSAIAGGKA